MPAHLPYDAVLCDIDGVLRHWPPAGDVEMAHALPAGAVAAAAFAPHRLAAAITGRITDEEWRAVIAVDLAEVCGSAERAYAAITAWSALVPRIDRDVAALLARVRDTVPLALVSNATTRLEADLERHGLASIADTVVNTARIGAAKPDPRVYRIAAQRVGAAVERCLFVDDTAANVAAAREIGMAAVHFRRYEDLREAVAPLLEPADPISGTL
jgi:putative hydrolase of the HAD superfamily